MVFEVFSVLEVVHANWFLTPGRVTQWGQQRLPSRWDRYRPKVREMSVAGGDK